MYSTRIPLRLRHFAPSASRFPTSVTYGVPNLPRTRRCIHNLRQLPYNVDEGLGNFLPPAALHMIAIDYQQGLLTRLNEQVKGTEMEHQSVTQTVISTASHQRHALAFNYASQALNNSFFLECLSPPPPPPTTNEDFMDHISGDIRLHFGSLAQLKSTFSAAAMGMTNSGWVWLVSDENGHMEVVATFGAGTLLVRSRHHMLSEGEQSRPKPVIGEAPLEAPLTRMASSNLSSPSGPLTTSPTSGMHQSVPGIFPSTPSRAFHASGFARQQDDTPNIFNWNYSSGKTVPIGEPDFDDMGDLLTPLLCVSVHEHAWIGAGYGIWGKEEYLKRFWTVVNWAAVGRAYEKAMSR